MGIDFMIRGMTNQKPSGSRAGSARSVSSQLTQTLSNFNGDLENILGEEDRGKISTGDANKVSFLTVPSSPDFRRPSTAEVVLEKLQVEKMDGGGMSISGVAIVANCHLSLMIFGGFFLLAGLVLSYIGYATGQKEFQEGGVAQAAGAPKGTFEKSNTHQQMRVIGPIFLVVGGLMFLVGVAMFAIHYKVNKDDKVRRLARSAVQLCQLENSFTQAQILSTTPIHTVFPSQNQSHPILSLRRGSWWMEPTPIEEPQTPCRSLDAPEYNISYSRNSTSPSPLHERNVQGLDWQTQNDAGQLPPYSLPFVEHRADPERQPKPSIRISVSHPIDPRSDIATFPSDDYSSVASFPVTVHPPDNEVPLSIERNHSPATQSLSFFEEDIARLNTPEERTRTISGAIDTDSFNAKADIGTANNLLTNNDIRLPIPVPRIQIGPGIQNRVTASYEGAKRLILNENSSAKNLPLSKNGVALPRLSRHSMSSRPPEAFFSNRPEMSYNAVSKNESNIALSQDMPYRTDSSQPN